VRRQLLPQAVEEWADASGRLLLVERVMPEGWAGRQLTDVEVPGRVRLVGVTRAGQPRLDLMDLVGQEGDQLQMAVMADALDELEARLGDAPAPDVAADGPAEGGPR